MKIHSRSKGFALIEALIAAVILAAGFVALTLLQVRLTKITVDARDRSVASHLAVQQTESMRNFTDYSQYLALNSSVGAQALGTESGTTYTRSWTVRRYRYNRDPNNDGDSSDAGFQLLPAADNTTELEKAAEFKRVTVSVNWTAQNGTARSIQLEDMISSATPSDGINTAKPSMATRVGPQVRIYKSTEEGVIPIAIGTDANGNELDSASSNPKPKQYADGSTGSTKFTVQTYASDQSNPLLQRQVDFAYASCSCKDGGVSTSTNPSYTTSYWDGLKYTSPKERVGAPIGVRNTAVDQDPQLCDTCCRDHHDVSGEATRADPFRPATYASTTTQTNVTLIPGADHSHFDPFAGTYTTASGTGGVYSEACKMVRVDGVYRVATDSNLEDLSILRMNRSSTGVATLPQTVVDSYAKYAKAYVAAAARAKGANASYPVGGLPNQKDSVGASYELAAASSYGTLFLDQNRDNRMGVVKDGIYNFASRGLYIDWLSPAALEKIACIGNSTDEACASYKNMNLLELVPFVAVNLTDLSHWASNDITQLVVRNDPIPLDRNGNTTRTSPFVRGQATAVTTNNSTVFARITRSNSGLVDTVAVDAHDLDDVKEDQEETGIGTSTTSPLGTFTAVVADSTGSRNFSAPSVLVQVISPVSQYPICIRGQTPKTNLQHQCVYDRNTLDIIVEFGNYNYKSCTTLGTKWLYDQANDTCVLPPANKGDPPQYGTPTVRDFELCTLVSPTNKVKVNTRTVLNPGTSLETTRFTLDRNGQANMGVALDGSTKQFTATFKMSCP